MIGLINGAMIMAPIIAGALFASNPKAAMAPDKVRRKKKLTVGIEAAFIFIAICSAGTLGSSRGFHWPVTRRRMIIERSRSEATIFFFAMAVVETYSC